MKPQATTAMSQLQQRRSAEQQVVQPAHKLPFSCLTLEHMPGMLGHLQLVDEQLCGGVAKGCLTEIASDGQLCQVRAAGCGGWQFRQCKLEGPCKATHKPQPVCRTQEMLRHLIIGTAAAGQRVLVVSPSKLSELCMLETARL